MAGKITFGIIKPKAVENGHIGAILHIINANGYKIKALRLIKMKKEQAREFYAIHKDKEFFAGLIDFMCSGPVVIMCVEKENAVEDFRKLIGSTDPKIATPGTIRKEFGTNLTMNAIHGSDSDENAKRETAFFFSSTDLF